MAVIRTDLDDVFGVANIDLWADLNNQGDATHIANRVTWAINLGTAKIKARFKVSKYVWSTELEADLIVKHLIVLQSGLLLYANRAVSEESKKVNPVREHKKEMDSIFIQILNGELALEVETQTRGYPAVVQDGVDVVTPELTNLLT